MPPTSTTLTRQPAPLPFRAAAETVLSAEDTMRLLRGVAGDAARLTTLLDRIRAQAGPRLIQGPDPALVALDQAAAAAHDLHQGTHTALAVLTARDERHQKIW